MKNIYCLVRIPRARRKVQHSGKSEYVPRLPLKIVVDGQERGTSAAYYPAEESGWRRADFLGSEARALELGKIGSTDDWLYLMLIAESRANVLRHLSADTEVWTLRDFLARFDQLPAEVRKAWPADWYQQRPIEDPQNLPTDPADVFDLSKPEVRGALSARASLAELGAAAPEEGEWETGSTLADAEKTAEQYEEIQ